MKTEEIKVYGISTYWPKKTLSSVPYIECGVEPEEIERCVRILGDLEFSRIEKKDRVHVVHDVVFPRRKLQAAYKCILAPAETAEVLVIDRNVILQDLKRIYKSSLWEHRDGWTREPSTGKTKEIYLGYTGNVSRISHKIKLIESFSRIIDVKCISLSEESLDMDTYEKINKMFSSDDEMKNLAMKMLTSFDYPLEKHKIATLLNANWGGWLAVRNKKASVETKSLLKKIQQDYPRCLSTTLESQINFWIGMFKLKEDDFIISGFNKFIAKHSNMAGLRARLVIEKDES